MAIVFSKFIRILMSARTSQLAGNVKMKSILFVCMGNICRSPAGEGVMRHLVAEHNLEAAVAIDSAGTIGYHTGKGADPRMKEAAAARGYSLQSRARQVTSNDLQEFDLVIAMDRSNYSELTYLSEQPRAEIRLLSDFLDAAQPVDVPDPYYGGARGFETVLDMIESACPAILEHMMAESGK